MEKALVIFFTAVVVFFAVIADYTLGMGGGYEKGYMMLGGMKVLMMFIVMAIGSFIFSLIFWGTHNWMVHKK